MLICSPEMQNLDPKQMMAVIPIKYSNVERDYVSH